MNPKDKTDTISTMKLGDKISHTLFLLLGRTGPLCGCWTLSVLEECFHLSSSSTRRDRMWVLSCGTPATHKVLTAHVGVLGHILWTPVLPTACLRPPVNKKNRSSILLHSFNEHGNCNGKS